MERQVLAGRYALVSLLGQGGMGSVWRAHHLELDAPVAVKLMDPRIAQDPEMLARFQREARAAAALRSPHVVQILDFGVDPTSSTPFIAMELLDGESLARRLATVGRLTPADTVRVLSELGRALARAHELGIVHRDLKPDNVFLVRNADSELVKVLDFGIAKSHGGLGSGFETRTGAVMGTPFYMSPEQISGAKNVDARTDLWALAVIAFECLTGIRPFQADTIGGLVLKICTEPLPRPSSCAPVPAGFDAWFERASARDPAWRFQTVGDFVSELARACDVSLDSRSRDRVSGHEPTVQALAPVASAVLTAAELTPAHAPHPHTLPPTVSAVTPHAEHAHGHEMTLFDMIGYPLREKGGLARIGWLLLLDYIPVLNLIILRGWRWEVARRFAHGIKPVLPEIGLILTFAARGLGLWFMTFLYGLVPVIIISQAGWGGIRDFISDAWTFLRIVAGFEQSITLTQFVLTELWHSLLAALVDGSWLLVSLPLYRAAMIRYAATERFSCFFDVVANLRFILAFPGSFAKLYLYSFLLSGAIAIGSAILVATGIGALVVPLVSLPVYYWTTAAEYGHLGHVYLEWERANPQKRGALSTLRTLSPALACLTLLGYCTFAKPAPRSPPSSGAGCGYDPGVSAARSTPATASAPTSTPLAARAAARPPSTTTAASNLPPTAAATNARDASVLALVRSYYSDLNHQTFDANRYFEPNVERYITMLNTSTTAMNSYVQRTLPKQFKDYDFQYEEGSLEREATGTYVFVEHARYFVVAKKEQQQKRYRVRVRVAPEGKMVFFQQFQPLPPAGTALATKP